MSIWWLSTELALPTDDREVLVRTPGGDERVLRYERGFWWLPDKSMYVYFEPTHWREVQT